MKHTIEYASSRREVWRAYWRAWAKPGGLWRFHVALGIAAAIVVWLSDRGGHFDRRLPMTAAVATLLATALLPLWPQLRFKHALRSLTIDATGFTTTIGALSGTRSWKDVSSIEDTGEEILIVGTNQNAMIVPNRAFENEAARRAFVEDAKSWHRASTTRH